MKIAILSAMNEEIMPTINAYEAKVIDKINEQEVYEYKGSSNEYLFLNSGIGKINAAITTTLLIDKYNPDLIISIGTAGGIGHNMQVSDFVVADKMAFWDVDVTAFNYEIGQLPDSQKYLEVKDYQKLVELIKTLKVNTHIGTIVTGDSFVCEDTKRQFIEANFENVHAIEMESTSILMTAQKLNTNCVVLRTISDMANEESSVSFDDYLKIVSEKFKLLVNELEKNEYFS